MFLFNPFVTQNLKDAYFLSSTPSIFTNKTKDNLFRRSLGEIKREEL